ncbi:uncharacterized membrane protein (UPF0127 family) [Delftia lacustris]|nr:uncharacterized membrane protein (UPF0127 family) [Delftia lacustris]
MTKPSTPLHTSLSRRALQRLLMAACLAGAAVSAGAQPQGSPQMNLRRVELTAGIHRIDAQVAASDRERAIGLMFRQDMPQQEGMIFVFEVPAVQCFWMRNTLLPLTAAFVADDGTIVNLADMKPMTEDSHCSAKPVRYVLEMNQGWFAKRGLKAGVKLGGSLFTPAPAKP